MIHVKIKNLRNKYNLQWLQPSMSYHKFPNLREQPQGDLGEKVNEGISSLDFDNLPCNCNAQTKTKNKCPYNNICWHSLVVYKATCNITKKFYINCTQQKVKSRMTQYFNEAPNLANKRLNSDTFAKHFVIQ